MILAKLRRDRPKSCLFAMAAAIKERTSFGVCCSK